MLFGICGHNTRWENLKAWKEGVLLHRGMRSAAEGACPAGRQVLLCWLCQEWGSFHWIAASAATGDISTVSGCGAAYVWWMHPQLKRLMLEQLALAGD
jgi:pyrroline-5-carboxylate reductase